LLRKNSRAVDSVKKRERTPFDGKNWELALGPAQPLNVFDIMKLFYSCGLDYE